MDLRRDRYTHGAVRRTRWTEGRASASDHAADRRSDIGLTRAFHPAAVALRRTIHSGRPFPAPSVRPSRPSFTLVTVSLTTPFCTMDVPSVRRLSDIQIRHSQIMTSKTRCHHPASDYLHFLVEDHKEPARGAPAATNKMFSRMFYQIISTVEFPSTMSSGEDEVLSCITTICPASSAAFQTIKHL